MIWRPGVQHSAGQRSVKNLLWLHPLVGVVAASYILFIFQGDPQILPYLPTMPLQPHIVFSGADDSCFKAWDVRDLGEAGKGQGHGQLDRGEGK